MGSGCEGGHRELGQGAGRVGVDPTTVSLCDGCWISASIPSLGLCVKCKEHLSSGALGKMERDVLHQVNRLGSESLLVDHLVK